MHRRSGMSTTASNVDARRGDRPDEVGPTTLDPERVVRPVGQRRERRRRGQHPQAELRWTRRRLAVPPDQAVPGAMGLGAGHLLFEDRRDKRWEDRPRAQDPDAGAAAGQPGDEGVRRVPEGLCPGAEEPRDRLEGPIRARAPPISRQPPPGDAQAKRGDAVSGPGGDPGPPRREADRPVTVSAHERAERRRQVEWSVQGEFQAGIGQRHTPSLSWIR